MGELPNGYFETYTGNHGIWKEHRLDAKAILRTLQGLPDFWAHLRELAATDRILSSVDVGAGEAAKSWPCSSGCSRPWSPWGWSGSCCTPTSLMTTSSRSTARRVAALPAGLQGKVTVNVLPQRFDLLVKSLRRGRVRLDPPPSFGTCLHMAYYLEQKLDTIPLLAEVPGVVGDDGLTFFVIEGPGQLQDLKQHLKRTRGLPEPASQVLILNTLRDARSPTPPRRW
jgi:hypothetical protein